MFDLISTKAATKLSGIEGDTLRQWRCRANPDRPQATKIGRDLFFRPLDLLAYAIAEQLEESTPTLQGETHDA